MTAVTMYWKGVGLLEIRATLIAADSSVSQSTQMWLSSRCDLHALACDAVLEFIVCQQGAVPAACCKRIPPVQSR